MRLFPTVMWQAVIGQLTVYYREKAKSLGQNELHELTWPRWAQQGYVQNPYGIYNVAHSNYRIP